MEPIKLKHVEECGQASAAGVKAFVDARYGITAHWGLYSLNGRGEWVYFVGRTP